MRSSRCVRASLALSALAWPISAQAPPPAGLALSGLIDGYYNLNFNHPASHRNQLRNFDVQADQFSLNMAKVTLEQSAEPLGLRLDLGFGRAFEIVHGTESAPTVFRHIEQAYISYKPPRARGLQLDFGKHVTMAGAEVIETSSNWNYSRSLLFAWAIPYYHFGLRASMPVGNRFSAGFHVVNGWNNVEDNNSGKTFGLSGSLKAGPVTWSNTYYAGPERTGTNEGWRHLYDTTLLVNGSRAGFYINYDYGVDRLPSGGGNVWYGVAGAARFVITDHVSIAPRVEWFNDRDGFSTGAPRKLKEFTLTGEYKLAPGILGRLEYRRDWSDRPMFERGAAAGAFKRQDTLLAGLIACFGPR